jgi:hypothetical protein
MNGKLKALGLALVAVLALSAVAASAASASKLHSGSASGTTYLTGTQIGTNQLDTEAGNIKCTTVGAKGSYAGSTTEEGTVEGLTYSGCTLGLIAHIDTMGCAFTGTAGTAPTTEAHIVCPTTAGGVTHEITIVLTQGGAPVCSFDIPEQTVELHAQGDGATPDGIEVSTTSKIKYTVTYPGAPGTRCGMVGAHSDGTYTGSFSLKGYSNAAHSSQVNLTYL